MSATGRMLQEKWGPLEAREEVCRLVYRDFNVLTLEIVADAVFGTAVKASADGSVSA